MSPAEKLMQKEGGELIPKELGGTGADPSAAVLKLSPEQSRKAAMFTSQPPPDEAGSPGNPGGRPPFEFTDHTMQSPPKSVVIKVEEGAVSTGKAPPPGSEKAAPRSPEQIARDHRLLDAINMELGIFDSVLNSVKRMIRTQVSRDPLDSAEIGQGLFGPGVRTPLEQSEPYIAIEVYRQVRRNIREEDGRGEKESDDTEEPSARPPVPPAPKQSQPGE